MFNKDLFGETKGPPAHDSLLASTWEYPPFTVWNAREGWWQERKRQWLALGIKSELGRGGGILMSSEQVTAPNLNYYRDMHKPSTCVTASQHGSVTDDE